MESKKISQQREQQFETLVLWVVRAEEKIKEIIPNQQENPFINVRFNPIIGAIINLLDANVLDNEL